MDNKLSDIFNNIENDLLKNPFADAQGHVDEVSELITEQFGKSLLSQKEIANLSPPTDDQYAIKKETIDNSGRTFTGEINVDHANPFNGPCPLAKDLGITFDTGYCQQILQNQWEHCRMAYSDNNYHMHVSQPQLQEMMFSVTAGALKHISAMQEFIGIQPMAGPCSVIYMKDSNGGISSAAVEARTLRLQSGMTLETMQDLNANNSITESVDVLSNMASEIGLQCYNDTLTELLHQAHIAEDDYSSGNDIAARLYSESYKIATRSNSGKGNKIIASNAIISNLIQSDALEVVDNIDRRYDHVTFVGTLNDMDVFCDSTLNKDDALVVRKGKSELDAGYFYCPYVLILSSGVVVNPVTFQPIISLMTRYGTHRRARKLDNGDFIQAVSDFVTKVSFANTPYSVMDDMALTDLFKEQKIESAMINPTYTF